MKRYLFLLLLLLLTIAPSTLAYNPQHLAIVIKYTSPGWFTRIRQVIKTIAIQCNLMKERPSFAQFDLSEATLENADFNGADLRGANFKSANLYNSNFEKTDLSDANLSTSNLYMTNFIRAYLKNATLAGSEIGGARFDFAHLNNANLSHSTASTDSETHEHVSFNYAQMINVILNHITCIGAEFRFTNLTNAQLHNAKFDDTKYDFEFRCLETADFSNATLTGASCINSNLSKERLTSHFDPYAGKSKTWRRWNTPFNANTRYRTKDITDAIFDQDIIACFGKTNAEKLFDEIRKNKGPTTTIKGNSFLNVAVKKNRPDIAKMLLKLGSNLTPQESKANTFLKETLVSFTKASPES